MAKPTTQRWTKLTIWPGDGAVPEVFTKKVCGMTTKSFGLAGATSDTVVVDCDDPDANPAWVERVMRSLSSNLAGAGVMAEENMPFYRTWALGGQAKNVHIFVDGVSVNGYFKGSFLLTKFDLTGNESDGKVNVSLSFDSDGAVTWVDGAP